MGAVLRLIYLNAKLIRFVSSEDRKGHLIENFSKEFENVEFIEALKFLLNSNDLSEYHNCIKKILKALKYVGENFIKIIPVELIENEQESPKLDKKALSQQRNEEITRRILT